MSKFDDCMEQFKNCMTNTIKVSFDEELLTKVAKGLGPSIYNTDASLVSGSDQSELDRLKANFLIKKLGLDDSPALDEAIKEVITQFGSSNRSKYRAVFYYLLTVKFNKQSVYA